MNENMKIILGNKELFVDMKNKKVLEKNGDEEVTYDYDKLVISVGDDEKKKPVKTYFIQSLKAVGVAFVITMAISAVWYGVEYMQFGTLQWDRECDNIVSTLYMIALTIGFSKWFEK